MLHAFIIWQIYMYATTRNFWNCNFYMIDWQRLPLAYHECRFTQNLRITVAWIIVELDCQFHQFSLPMSFVSDIKNLLAITGANPRCYKLFRILPVEYWKFLFCCFIIRYLDQLINRPLPNFIIFQTWLFRLYSRNL